MTHFWLGPGCPHSIILSCGKCSLSAYYQPDPVEVGGGKVETLALALRTSLVGGGGKGSSTVGRRIVTRCSPRLCVEQHRGDVLDMARWGHCTAGRQPLRFRTMGTRAHMLVAVTLADKLPQGLMLSLWVPFMRTTRKFPSELTTFIFVNPSIGLYIYPH